MFDLQKKWHLFFKNYCFINYLNLIFMLSLVYCIRPRSHRHEYESGTVCVSIVYFNGSSAAVHIHTSTGYL